MIAPIIYGNGKIQDIEAAKKKILVPKPKPGLFTSSTNRWGALILGIFLFYVGAGTAYHLIVDPGKEWPLIYIIVLIIGLSCLPVGSVMAWKAFSAFHKAAHPIRFFYYDDARIVLGMTNAVDKIGIKRIRSMPITERINGLISLSSEHTTILVGTVEYVELNIDKIMGHIGKIKIKSSEAEIVVEISKLLPTLDLFGKSDKAFNSISQYYTRATGKAINASIENP